jgi:hypothetical protein
MTVRIGAILPMNEALATFVPISAIWKKPTSAAKASPARMREKAKAAGSAGLIGRAETHRAQTASAGTANPIRQAAPANGPTSRKRTRTPDQAMMPVPIRSAIQPSLSTEGDLTAEESVTQAFDAPCTDRERFFVH